MPANGQSLPVCPKCRQLMEQHDSHDLRLEMIRERFHVFRCPACGTWHAEPASQAK
jgi:RNase P subunit RPR2